MPEAPLPIPQTAATEETVVSVKGLCECGCGRLTPIADRTRRDLGSVRGQPVRFIKGHSSKNAARRSDEVFIDYVRRVISYDPMSGQVAWRRSGKYAGSKHSAGYLSVGVDGTAHLCHRLAWFYVHGEWPSDQLDHINGNRADNRLVNLRECSNAENCQNVRSHKDATSRHVGVSFDKRNKSNPWAAQIFSNGQKHFLGYFPSQETASAAYKNAKTDLHKFNPTKEAA
jgi:hypothetical protein